MLNRTPRPVFGVSVVLSFLFAAVAYSQPPASVPETQPATPAKATPPRVRQTLIPEGVKDRKNIEYAKPDDKPVRLDLYLPQDAKSPTPLVIWVHGGGWEMGSKDYCPAAPFCRDGFAVASIQYRLTDRAPFPAQIYDCKAAVRFLRAHAKEYNLDPQRFGAWGASAGGHLVCLLGTTAGEKDEEGDLGNADQSSAVQCVCDWFGPTDFGTISPRPDAAPMLVKLFGGKPSEKPELVKLASPLAHVSKSDPPFLIVQGDADPLVPVQQSRALHEALKAAGVASELVIVKGGGHGFREERALEEFARVRRFFVDHLKPASAKPAESAPGGQPKPEPASSH